MAREPKATLAAREGQDEVGRSGSQETCLTAVRFRLRGEGAKVRIRTLAGHARGQPGEP